VRAKVAMPADLSNITQNRKVLVFDREKHRVKNHAFLKVFDKLDTLKRGEKTLRKTLSIITSEQP
jgi:hypothetical protein